MLECCLFQTGPWSDYTKLPVCYEFQIDLSKKQRYVSSKMHYGKSELKKYCIQLDIKYGVVKYPRRIINGYNFK